MRRIVIGLMATLIMGGLARAGGVGSATGLMAVLHNCQDETVVPSARVEACTAFIHTNLLTHPLLANVYAHRALAYEAEGDLDHAIEDYNKALELKPDYEEVKADRDRLVELKAQAQPPAAGPSSPTGSP